MLLFFCWCACVVQLYRGFQRPFRVAASWTFGDVEAGGWGSGRVHPSLFGTTSVSTSVYYNCRSRGVWCIQPLCFRYHNNNKTWAWFVREKNKKRPEKETYTAETGLHDCVSTCWFFLERVEISSGKETLVVQMGYRIATPLHYSVRYISQTPCRVGCKLSDTYQCSRKAKYNIPEWYIIWIQDHLTGSASIVSRLLCLFFLLRQHECVRLSQKTRIKSIIDLATKPKSLSNHCCFCLSRL